MGLRLRNYECPTALEDWEDDFLYLYIMNYLRGKGSAEELAKPLLSDIHVGWYSQQDIRISMDVYTTAPPGIADAVGRIGETIAVYHSDWFQQMKGLYEEKSEQFRDDPDTLGLRYGADLAKVAKDQDFFQAYGSLYSYFTYKLLDDLLG